MSRRAAAVLALAGALALAGCAGPALRAAPPVPAPVPAATGPVAGAPTPRTGTPAVAVARPDTVPSADALAVLAEIPEPLPAGERAGRPAPAPIAGARSAETPFEPADAGGGEAGVPVPTRTPVLGERPLPDVAVPADAAPPAAAAPPPAAAAPPSGAAAPDTCWRVQLAAWAERAKAERYLAAARSQLGVPLAIEKEAELFKVRGTDCLGAAAADALRRRAREAGFEGAFRFRGGKP